MIDPFGKFVDIAYQLAGKTFGETSQELGDHPFEKRNIHPKISGVSKPLFDNEHYQEATFKACKLLEKRVQEITKSRRTGQKLMNDAFSTPKDSTKCSAISLSSLEGESATSEQDGYRFLFCGAVTGIRNPRGHEIEVDESVSECLDHLSLISFLMRKLDDVQKP